jgi:hypothetical protein
MKSSIGFASLFAGCFFVASAFAGDAPSLPSAAKKLNKAEIVALYNGKTLPFVSYKRSKPLTGTTTFDFASLTTHGTYDYNNGEKTGKFRRKISFNGDQVCNLTQDDEQTNCYSVYSAGRTAYAVVGKKVIAKTQL